MTGEPFRVGRILGRSFDTWRRQLLVLVVMVLVVHAPRVASAEALARLWQIPVEEGGGLRRAITKWLVTTLIDALFTGLSVAPVVFAVYARLQGRDARVGESLHGGLRRFLPVLRVSLSLALLAATLSCAAGVSLMPFVVRRLEDPSSVLPLLWALNFGVPLLVTLLLSPFWVAVPAAVVETPGRGLRRSWRLTRGRRLAVCLVLVLLHAVTFGTRWTVTEIASGDIFEVLYWTVELLVVSLNAVVVAVGYHALRLEKEGVDVSKLVDVFA